MSNNILAVRIKARNKVNQLANELQEKLIKGFSPLIGKKVVNADNYICKPLIRLLPIINVKDFQMYQNASQYSLGFTVKVCENILNGCVYEETSFYVGHLNSGTGVLEKVQDISVLIPRRIDFTAEEIIKAREICEVKREEARQAENALCGFGTYDR